jgi:hypothetical protein
VENSRLAAQATGQPKAELYASTPTRFFLVVVPAEIEFVADAKGNITSLVLHQGGQDMKAPRKMMAP